MSWATHHIEKLRRGETVQFRPHGHSMAGRIESGELVTVEPVGDVPLRVNDAVLCTVNGKQFLHLIKAKDSDGRFLIGNNRGHTNGWTSADRIFGRVTSVTT